MLNNMLQFLVNLLLKGYLKDLVMIFFVLVPAFILKAEKDQGGGNGESKKNQVVNEVKAIVKKPGGLELPDFVLDEVLPVVIDILIHFFNSSKNGKSGSGN